MKKHKFIIIVIWLMCFSFWIFISCSTPKKVFSDEKHCNENLIFKKVFFENIHNVENLIYKEQNASFHKSLKFISKYSNVSFESMANYARTYPSGVFEDDKTIWLKWYEDNKCKNIQFKDSIH
jgi:hypothetical protein